LVGWQPSDTIATRTAEINTIISSVFSSADAAVFLAGIGHLPGLTTIEELRDYLWADNDDQRANLVSSIYTRLSLQPPTEGFLPPAVRLMTMHGAKGLDAQVVFIPSLEDDLLPGSKRSQFTGLILEAARMLYVSITRARAVCVLSFAERRTLYGKSRRMTPSRFLQHLGGAFCQRNSSLDQQEVTQVQQSLANL
jgi:superfamily I DNA/RNA helicase